jgi:exopolyphosphatase/guanosine-5'-triphosphate,3'-diphosphate pyrophosphatase
MASCFRHGACVKACCSSAFRPRHGASTRCSPAWPGSLSLAVALAAQIAEWTEPAVSCEGVDCDRQRLAAAQLALAAAHVEPNLRARHAYEWAMDKRWVGLDPEGRARVAAALLAACGKIAPPDELERLASRETLNDAIGWGLAIRLARRLAAGSGASLRASSLLRESDSLILTIEPERAHLVSERVLNDLRNLALWLGLEPRMQRRTAAVTGANTKPDLTQV